MNILFTCFPHYYIFGKNVTSPIIKIFKARINIDIKIAKLDANLYSFTIIYSNNIIDTYIHLDNEKFSHLSYVASSEWLDTNKFLEKYLDTFYFINKSKYLNSI